MAHVKGNSTTQSIKEFSSSFGVDDSIPDPVTLGDAHDGRNADQSTAEREAGQYSGAGGAEQPTHVEVSGTEATKSEMISHIMQSAYGMDRPELAKIYDQLSGVGGFGGDTHDGRGADQSTGADREPESYREDVALVLAGSNLSEDAINRATTLFEAAVNNRMIEVVAKLDEVYQGRMDEAIEAKTAELDEVNTKYMDYISEKWMEENQVAIDSNIRVELAESFMQGLHALFEDHYIDVPEDAVDVVEALSDRVEELEAALSASEAEAIERDAQEQEEEVAAIRESALERASAGLTESQKERLSVLAESVSFNDEDDLVESLKAMSVLTLAGKSGNGANQLNEEIELDESQSDADIDPVIASIGAFISQKQV